MEINEELTNEILGRDFKNCNYLDDMWVIVYNNMVFAPKQGRMFHGSYTEAQKHFYSQMRWKVLNKYKQGLAKEHGFSDWWNMPKSYITKSDRQIWDEFKNYIFENGFNIIQWKNAKGNVCS